MQEIENSPDISISELSVRLSIHQSTCSQLVEKLADRGLVFKKRSKEDQRRVGLHLTDDASRLMKGAPGHAEGLLQEALVALPIGTIQALDSALEELIEQLQVKDNRLAEKPLSEM